MMNRAQQRIVRGVTGALAIWLGCGLSSPAAQAETVGDGPVKPVAEARLRYEVADAQEVEHSMLEMLLPRIATSKSYFSEPVVRESAALATFVAGLKTATAIYFADLLRHCEAKSDDDVYDCPRWVSSCEDWEEQEREYRRLVCLGNADIAPDIVGGQAALGRVLRFLEAQAAALPDGVLARELDLASKLRVNIQIGGSTPPYQDWGEANSPSTTPSRRVPRRSGSMSRSFGGAAGLRGGGLGVTPGGAQDAGILRAWVQKGYVPLPSHFATEGLLSEHDLPLAEGEPCDQLMCVRGAVAQLPALDRNEAVTFVQLGFSSGLDAASFRRRPLNLAVVLDRSGSMNDHAGEERSKIEAVKAALLQLVGQLGPQDRLAIVLFNREAETLWPSAPLVGSDDCDADRLRATIEGITAGGGTNIEAGLRRGFEIVAGHSAAEVRSDRVILLTDALPNVGETGEDDFLTLARRYADRGIGLTTLGVGVNFGQELALAISQIRGGNFFFLEDQARIDEIFTVDFDYLVTPVAYDFRVTLVPSRGFRVRAVHGVSSWNGSDAVEIDVATLFLSRNRGAIVIELAEIPLTR
jgi:Ca-activated chloride channel family protein